VDVMCGASQTNRLSVLLASGESEQVKQIGLTADLYTWGGTPILVVVAGSPFGSFG